MSLKQLIKLLLRYKLWIISIPVLVALLVFFLSKNLYNQYESKAIVFTNPSSNQGATEGGMVRVDFYTSNNLFDNLTLLMKSRETLTEASLKLLAHHLSMEQASPEIISAKSFEELKKHVSPTLKNEIAVVGNPVKTYQNLVQYHLEHPNSAVDYLLREHPHYGVPEILNVLFVARKSTSDMMEVIYKSDDPGVCYYTLKYILDAFMRKYEQMKEQENTTSILYFEEQLRSAKQGLIDSELNLKGFISSNQILNYYEQGKYLDMAKLEQDQDEERAKRLASGTKSNLDQIEVMFSDFEGRKITMDTIASLQGDLSKKQMEMDGLNVLGVERESLKPISEEINALQNELGVKTETLFEHSLSGQGIPRKSILDEWLRLKIQYEEQVQSIEVMQDRKEFISDRITEFAPLGAELNILEREVTINENQYLSILHGLNMANLKKHELAMASSQKLIDVPFYPKKPLPSKRKYLVVGGFLGSGFMVVSILLLFFFLDPTIKSADHAFEMTHIPIAGAWINEKRLSKQAIKPQLFRKLIKQFYNHISPYLQGNEGKKFIVLYSIRDGEGKSFLAQKLMEELKHQNGSISRIGPAEEGTTQVSQDDYTPYDDRQVESNNPAYWNQLLDNATGDTVLFELPNIQFNNINFELMNRSELVILVMDASRGWSKSDKMHLENVQKGLTKPQVIWLNKMNEEGLEDLNGELPKKRNKIRVFIKNLIS